MTQTFSLRNRLSIAVAAFAFACTAGLAHAQAFPDKAKPLKIIVPSGAASVVDLLGRAYGKAMTETSGVNVIVDNKPGAELVIGVQAFLTSPADGYTLLVTSSSSQVMNPVLLPNLPYDPVRQMIPVGGIGKGGLTMNLGPSTTFRTAREFVAAAKANPGKYTCASASTTTRIACELLEATAGVKLLNVPYKATAAAMTGVASGEADLMFVDAGSARAFWQTGRVRAVAVTQTTRMPTMAQVPTLREEGVHDYDLTAWYAAYLPQRTPPEVVNEVRGLLRKAAGTPAIAETLTSFSLEPLDLTADEIVALNRREIDRWQRLVRDHGIKTTQ